MKKTLVSLCVLGLALSTGSVFAYDKDDIRIPPTPAISFVAASSERQEKIATTSLARLKQKGNRLIDERISSLQSNEKAIAKSSLTAEQKAVIISKITTNVTGLTTLKTAINGEVNATTTKGLVESIYTNFRIYGIVIPQIRLEKRINDLQNHVVKLNETFAKVQMKINEARTNGKDVTIWQKNLDDAKVLVNNDSNKLASLLVQVRGLTPANYGTSSKATIESVNTGIKAIVKDFYKIEKSVKKPSGLKLNATSTAVIR